MVCRVGGILCWRMSVNLQPDMLVCRVGGLPTYTTQDTSNTTDHFTPPTCVVGLPTCVVGGFTDIHKRFYRHTQNTSNTTYHWCVVYVVTFRPSYYSLEIHCRVRLTILSKKKLPSFLFWTLYVYYAQQQQHWSKL